MQTLSGTVTRRYTRLMIMSAVIFGCALFVPAVCPAATIRVDIIKPDTNPVVFDAGKEHDFEAVAFIEGVELEGGQVTWDWDFGDGSDHSTDNPTTHTYAARGNFHVVVTATYSFTRVARATMADPEETTETLTGQAALSVQAAAAGTEDAVKSFKIEFRYGSFDGPKMSQGVCDSVYVVVSRPLAGDWPYWVGARFFRDGILQEGAGWPSPTYGTLDGNYCRLAYFPWATIDRKNGWPSSWQVELTLQTSPPPGQEGPGFETVLLPPQTATPNNMVIAAGGPLIIEHKAGDQVHTLTWGSTHLDDQAAGVPREYGASVQVFSLLSGSQVDTGNAQFTINTGASWDWHPQVGGPGGDSDGLYTFLVTSGGSYADCDSDKVDLISNVRNVEPIGVDWDTLKLKGKMAYSIGTATVSPKLHIYGPTTADIDLPTTPGDHEVEYQLDIGYGSYSAVVTATQTPEDGAANRDGKAKPVLPKGCYLGAIPGPPTGVEILTPTDRGTQTAQNHFRFGEGDPVCNVSATGRVLGAGGLEGGLSWHVPTVSGSELTTTPENCRGPAIDFQYSQLPASNSQFGPKTLTLSHPLVSQSASQTIEIFFSKDAFNHPGQALFDLGTPNWYYYWRQGVVSDLAQFRYSPSVAYGATDISGNVFVGMLAAGSNPGPTEVHHRFSGARQDIGAGGMGIDCCAETCAHELKHRWLRQNQGNLVDTDGDGLSDVYEASTAGVWNLDPLERDTYNLAQYLNNPDYASYGDEEFVARMAEQNPGATDPSADWASPGKNGMGRYLNR